MNLETKLSSVDMLRPPCTSTQTPSRIWSTQSPTVLFGAAVDATSFSHTKSACCSCTRFSLLDSTLRTCSSSRKSTPRRKSTQRDVNQLRALRELRHGRPIPAFSHAFPLSPAREKQVTLETVFFQKVKTKANGGNKE